MDTAEIAKLRLLAEWTQDLISRAFLHKTADTIERLQKALTKTEQERDAALAEVERLTKERVIFTAPSRTVSMDEAREMFPDSEAK